MAKTIVAVLFLATMAVAANAAEQKRTTIPTQNTIIVLPANGRAIEVDVSTIERYRCASGRLVARAEGHAARTSTRKTTLRCITSF